MKDLYKRLGVSPRASASELEIAAQRAPNRALRDAVLEVLLTPRRATYDLAHAELRRLGQLRTNLGLTHTPLWLQTGCGDFDGRPSSIGAQLEAIRGPLRPQPAVEDDHTSRRLARHARPLVVLAAVILFADPVITFIDDLGSADSQTAADGAVSGADSADRRGDESATLMSAQPLPPTGVLSQAYIEQDGWPQLRVTAGDASYYVKVVVASTRLEVARLFVQPRSSTAVSLPPGSYRIRYLSGKVWYGEKHFFGPDTYAAEGGRLIRLEVRQYEDHVETLGREVILERGKHGNLPIDVIDVNDF